MAVIEAENVQTTIIGQTHTLFSAATGLYRVLVIDLTAMRLNDTVILTALAPVIVGGQSTIIRSITLYDVQAEPNNQSLAFDMMHGGQFTLTQTTGQSRIFGWHVTAHGG